MPDEKRASTLANFALAQRPLMAFVAMGIFWGAWSALIPDVQRAVGADDAALGQALLCVSVGAVPAMIGGGALVDRFGSRLLAPSVLAFAVMTLLPAFTNSAVLLGVALLLVGGTSGLMDVVMNSRVSALEALHGRHLMSACHGTFSLTFFIAAVLTGLLRGAGLGVLPVLGGSAVLIAILSFLASGGQAPAPVHTEKAATSGSTRGWLSLPVLLLGLAVFCAFLSENGLQQWSALHLERSLGAPPEISSLGPAILGLAFATGRFGGNFLIARIGAGMVVILGAILAGLATLVFSRVGGVPLALAAVFLSGIGISVVGPSALGLVAGFVSEAQRGRAVAAVSTIAYTGFFVGPALLGFIAETNGLPIAIATIAGFCVAVLPIWALLRTTTKPMAAGG